MEFKEYDTAFAKQYKNVAIKAMPLVSWDIYSQYLLQTNLLINDVNLLHQIANKNQWESLWDFKESLQDETVIVVTDTQLKIVFASKNIKKMNGYEPYEVIGNSPKMFQGAKTDLQVSNEIRQAILNKVAFDKNVINYCKNGALYKCHIKGFPIFNNKGEVINFIAFEKIAA
jgi:PAS domain S-box-containing protein